MYAPVFATTLATRCRLQRKFNRKKELKEKDEKFLSPPDDSRSVDELLEFIGQNNPMTPAIPGNSVEIPKKKTSKRSKRREKKRSEKKEISQNFQEDPEDHLDENQRAELDREVEEFRQKLESINSQSRKEPKLQFTGSFSSSMVGVH
eukprot:TRINITY_DN976_c0_g1_i5.p1 TRINITY_DN976_c0_g1~~TRINITY_DN976_c0_g1_i5.p1  ORF type:complete len:148 (-),score=37.84 TRINITY_DN976_c0_g1_i5:120-563(-)